MIGQKGIQGAMPSGGQSQLSEHSPHTLRRGNELLFVSVVFPHYSCNRVVSICFKATET